MRPNVKQFLQLLAEDLSLPTPVVDIGSLRTEGQEDYADLRPYFGPDSYTGFDMRHGPGVDCLGTIHRLPLAAGSVGTVILLDTLEHVLDPLAALHEVTRVLRPGGVAVISSHMNFPIHAHPSDYWRFTPMVFDYLLRMMRQRFVFAQGDAENPHTVLGVGMLASPEEAAAAAFRSAVRHVQERWPEDSFGGPLCPAQPLLIDAGQRLAERDLPLLVEGHSIAQSFLCLQDGLSRIDVLMANASGPNFRHVVFNLREDESGHEVGAYRLSCLHVVDGGWVSVPIPPQHASAGKRYVLTIESPDGEEGQAVSAKASQTTTYPDGQLLLDGEPIEGSLCFHAYCQMVQGALLDPWAAREAGRSEPLPGGAERPPAPTAEAQRLLSLEEQGWHQARYLAAVNASMVDGLREQLRIRNDEMLDLERRTFQHSANALQHSAEAIELSRESLAILRSLNNNPLLRAWRRINRKGSAP